MSLDEKRAYISGLTPDQKSAFLSNMTPEDYKSLIKQLPIDNKAEIIDGMADITGQLGLTLSVDELTDDNFVLSMKDQDGKLVAQSAASDTVAATGYDRRGILALAAALAAMGIAGTAYIVNKSFGGKEV
jgi:Mg/Co/Ni transporter MgtE